MSWNERFTKGEMPDLSTVSSYIGSPLWEGLCEHIEVTYGVSPTIEHSVCSMASGWNLKYKKSGRALCTLYPAEGYFTCLVSIGRKEAQEAELLLPAFGEYMEELYWNTKLYNGGRWLMIDVTSAEILEEVKLLIGLRVKPKKTIPKTKE